MVSLLSIPSSPVESSSTGSLVGQPQMRIKRRNSVTDKVINPLLFMLFR